jgi:17beta-estradiol 17-dehydrogenase / very-long-chain 3-oxoacyl-CoA reductase
LRSQHDLQKRYGDKDSWVVVTGGSDGIGFQYCLDMAKQGFNICIIGRNEQKIKEKLEEIRKVSKKGSDFKTRAIVADLGKITKIQEYEPIASKLKDIDIALLFLNAGWTMMGPFIDLRPEEIQEIVTVNAIHPVYLLKVLLNQLLARKQRSGIIITSSGVGSFPAAGMITYSASKAFASFLGQGLNYELKDSIDVMSFECGETGTKLLRRRADNYRILSPQQVTKASVRDLGREKLTYGALAHELAMYLSWLVPLSFI